MIDTQYHHPLSLSLLQTRMYPPLLLELTCVYNLDSHYSEITRSDFYLKVLNVRTSLALSIIVR